MKVGFPCLREMKKQENMQETEGKKRLILQNTKEPQRNYFTSFISQSHSLRLLNLKLRESSTRQVCAII